MYIIDGFCSICGSSLGIRICEQGHAFILCDECWSAWKDPELADEPCFPSVHDRELLCPHGNHGTLLGHWATKEEIEQIGWWNKVKGESSSYFE